MSTKKNNKHSFIIKLLAELVLIIAGMILFYQFFSAKQIERTSATSESAERAINQSGQSSPEKEIHDPFKEHATQSDTGPRQNDQQNETVQQQSNPDDLIDAYLAARQNGDPAQQDQIWDSIKNCIPCIKQLENRISAMDNGAAAELIAKIIQIDNYDASELIKSTIGPMKNLNLSIQVAQEMLKTGRRDYTELFIELVKEAEAGGYGKYAYNLSYALTSPEEAGAVVPMLDLVVGRNPASTTLTSQMEKVLAKTFKHSPDQQLLDEELADYYLAANKTEQDKLWKFVQGQNDSLVALTINAYENGDSANVDRFTAALTDIPKASVVDNLIELHQRMDYPPEYFADLMQTMVKKNPNREILHRVEDYVRDQGNDLQTRIIAVEGLLAAKDTEQGSYILNKMLTPPINTDAEILSYINGRL
jgi:hypothetical protein